MFFLTLFDSQKNDSNLKYFPTKFQTIKILFEEAETTKKKLRSKTKCENIKTLLKKHKPKQNTKNKKRVRLGHITKVKHPLIHF